MAVFSPDNHTIRETINVDYKTRMTNQEVVFINNDNVFQGTFQGKVNMTGGVLSAGDGETVEIKNATLKNVVLEDEEGKKVNLSDYSTSLNDLETNLETLSETVGSNKTDADEKITNLETTTNDLVNAAREELSAYVVAKVVESGGESAADLETVKTALKTETESRETKDTELETAIKTLKSEVDGISETTSGGLIFQNTISVFRTDTSFLTVFQRRGYEDDESLRNGFMYSVDLKDCDSVTIEGMDIENGDYLIVRAKSGSVLVKDIDVSYIVKIDAMDKKALENVVQSVNDEKDRAQTQEMILGSKTDAEIERAKSEEASIKKSVSDEISNRQTADATTLGSAKTYTNERLGSYYTSEKANETFLKKEDAKLTYSTIDDFTRLTENINNRIEIEKNRAVVSEESLDKKITEEQKARQTVQDTVDAEKTNRETADTNLKTELTAEISKVKDSVTAEYNRSAAAEETLTTRIGAEETRAKKAENDLQTGLDKVSNDLASEIENRKSAVSNVEKSISDETERAKNRESDLETKIDANSSSITTLGETITSDITKKLASEEERAKAEEKKLQDSITEITGTKIPEVTKALTEEVSRAKTEENQIRTDLGNSIVEKVSVEEKRAKEEERDLLEKIHTANSNIT